MRRKKLRPREEPGASSSLGLEAAIDESTRQKIDGAVAGNGSTSNGDGGGGDHGSRASRAARDGLSKGGENEIEAKRARFDTALARARANEKLTDSFVKPAHKDKVQHPFYCTAPFLSSFLCLNLSVHLKCFVRQEKETCSP